MLVLVVLENVMAETLITELPDKLERQMLTPATERQGLMPFAGMLSPGQATGLDNDAIDADLAKAYDNNF